MLSLQGRAALTGMTGTGKSTLARVLLSGEKRVLVIDPKWSFKPLPVWGREYEITGDPLRAARNLHRRNVIYRPAVEADMDNYDTLLREAWKGNQGRRRNPHTLYCDEIAMMCAGPTSFPRWLKAYWQQGRELGLRAIGATQRPSGVPLWLFSESEQHYMFRLLLARDLKRAAEWIGREALRGTARAHSFWYRNVGDERPGEYELAL